MEPLSHWIALKNVPGIGNLLFKRLVDRFGSPQRVLTASAQALRQVEGVNVGLSTAIGRHPPGDAHKREIERVWAKGWRIVTMADDDYPPLLLEIPDPPPYLYLAGHFPANGAYIAVVGSRNATAYGIEAARRLSGDLAAWGITVVSGMAVGIDTAAHRGALAGAGSTLAVLGSGLCRIYPHENRKLFHQIVANGGVISEFGLDAEPEAHHFPQRNRIISGICIGTVVVEATRKSGSLITARLAAEQNRDVFAVPGSIQSFKSTGTHNLIKQGAKLVEHAGDIIDEFPLHFDRQHPPAASGQRKSAPPLSSMERRVYDSLDAYAAHIDQLVDRLQIDAGGLAALLLQLEVKGLVTQMPGKFFKRNLMD